MKALTLLLLALLLPAVVRAQAPEAPKSAPAPKPSREDLESRFQATLAKATFSGRWSLIEKGQSGPEKEDKYTILGVSKVGGEVWLIHARIQYGGKDITAPIPVQVRWAGDTPVIVVDDVGVPGSGKYSARVLIHQDTYAGTWSGGGVRGLMSGVITRARE